MNVACSALSKPYSGVLYLEVGGRPEVQLKGAVAQRLELLVVLVIADANYGHLAGLDDAQQLAHATPVPTRHAIHFVHHQADLHSAQQFLGHRPASLAVSQKLFLK